MTSWNNQNSQPNYQQHHLFASFGSPHFGGQSNEHSGTGQPRHHQQQVSEYGHYQHHTEQVHRPQPAYILTVNNTNQNGGQAFPQLAELVESLHGTIPQTGQLIINNWQPQRVEPHQNSQVSRGEVKLASQSPSHHQQLNHYGTSRPTQKAPLLAGKQLPQNNSPALIRQTSASKLEVPQQNVRSMSGSIRDSPSSSGITVHYQHPSPRKDTPIIIGSKAFDNLLAQNSENRQKSQSKEQVLAANHALARHKIIDKQTVVESNKYASRAMIPPLSKPNQNQPPKAVAGREGRPPLPDKARNQRELPAGTDQRRFRTEVTIPSPSDNSRYVIANPENGVNNANTFQTFPTPSAVSTTVANVNRQGASPAKLINGRTLHEYSRSPPDSTNLTDGQDLTNFPSPINMMKRESLESIKPSVNSFTYPQPDIVAERKITSPISSLAGLSSQVKQVVIGEEQQAYVSRGLAFFSGAIRTIPQTTSITNSNSGQQWSVGHFGNALLNSGSNTIPVAQSMEQQNSILKTPTFSVISQSSEHSGQIKLRSNERSQEVPMWQHPVQQQHPHVEQQYLQQQHYQHQQYVQQNNQQPSQQQHPQLKQEQQEQRPKIRGIPASFRPQIVEPVTSLPAKEAPVVETPIIEVIEEPTPPVLTVVYHPPTTQHTYSELETVFSFLPIIEVLYYMPEKAVQMPESGDIFYYPLESSEKELVDRSVQWYSKIGRDINQESIYLSHEPTIITGVAPPFIESEEVVIRREQVDKSMQVDLVDIQPTPQQPVYQFTYNQPQQPQQLPQQQQFINIEVKTQQPVSPVYVSPLPRNNALETGLRVIYGEEGTKKYEYFLRGVERNREIVQVQPIPLQPDSTHVYAFRQALSIQSESDKQLTLDPILGRKSSSKDQTPTTNTTAIHHYEHEIAKNYNYYEAVSSPVTTTNIASDKIHDAFDRYAEAHSNQYIHEYPSWKELPDLSIQHNFVEPISHGKYSPNGAVGLITNFTPPPIRYNTLVRTTSENANNQRLRQQHQADTDATQPRSSQYYLRVVGVEPTADRTNNLVGDATQQRSRSRTPLTNLPKLLSYEDLRLKLHQDESELRRQHH